MKDITKLWIKFANKDLQGAKKLLEQDGLENLVLFHCHQAIEKIFKATLEEKNIKFPKIHGIRTLYEIIKKNININTDEDILIEIDSIYIDSRYPSGLGILPNGFPTKNEAKRIYEDL